MIKIIGYFSLNRAKSGIECLHTFVKLCYNRSIDIAIRFLFYYFRNYSIQFPPPLIDGISKGTCGPHKGLHYRQKYVWTTRGSLQPLESLQRGTTVSSLNRRRTRQTFFKFRCTRHSQENCATYRGFFALKNRVCFFPFGALNPTERPPVEARSLPFVFEIECV